ncbi:MAG: nucleotide exchange factor GrpE [Planctomycetota bacterium]|nr:nucleotide exchange factor GrpE [Planctomycetota bacterium]
MENPENQQAQAGAESAPDMAELIRQRDEFRDMVKGVRAEFENYQKRQQRELAAERKFAQGPLALDLLPAIDNLDRALESARKSGDSGPLATGIQMVIQQMLDQLKRHGIVRMEARHQPYDAAKHAAVTQIPTTEHPPMTVLEVLEPGYMHHDRVLRPASVAVAVAPPVAAAQE